MAIGAMRAAARPRPDHPGRRQRRRVRRHRPRPARGSPAHDGPSTDPSEGRRGGPPAPGRRPTTGPSQPRAPPAGDAPDRARLDRPRAAPSGTRRWPGLTTDRPARAIDGQARLAITTVSDRTAADRDDRIAGPQARLPAPPADPGEGVIGIDHQRERSITQAMKRHIRLAALVAGGGHRGRRLFDRHGHHRTERGRESTAASAAPESTAPESAGAGHPERRAHDLACLRLVRRQRRVQGLHPDRRGHPGAPTPT